MTWYAFRTVPQRERTAAEILASRFDLATMLPLETRFIRRSDGTKKKEKSYPALVGYVLADLPHDAPWYRILNLDCIISVVGFDGRPAPLNTASVERLSRVNHITSSVPNRRKSFQKGDHVCATSGPLYGMETRIEDIRGCRARVIVELLGSRREVEIHLSQLQAA